MAAVKHYPAIRFVLRYGNTIAALTGAAVVLLGIWGWLEGLGWLWGVVLVLAGLLGFLVLRTFTELVDVVADTLLPPE